MLKGEQDHILGGDKMSNSSLITYTKISPNKTSPRNHKIDTITIHCMAGNLSIESCGNVFVDPNRKASSNYGIGSDGRIGMYVEEKDRSWCSSDKENDNRAITIEVANDGGAETGWHVSDKAMTALINLLTDVCKRNGIKKLLWKADKRLIGQIELQNMTVHRWFAAKACPGDYLFSKHSWIANEVNKRLNDETEIIQNEKEIIDRPKRLWDALRAAGFTDIATAGIMGNLYDESHFSPNNLQNSFEKKFNMNDEAYTLMINTKLYPEESFVKDGAGYGLAQWTYWTRKQGLYEYTIKQGYEINDFGRQIEFMIKEMNDKKGFVSELNSKKSIEEATNIVLTQYEKPADQGSVVLKRRSDYAKLYYNKFSDSKVVNESKTLYTVKVRINNLNIRKGPGLNYDKNGKVTGIGTFTIVDESNGWGLLKAYQKNRDGWISLDYVER